MNKFERFVRIEKVDPEQRMVWGYASTPDLDSQGERVSIKAIEDALPDYMRFGNIREMHRYSAVGKTKSAEIDEKGLHIGAKIVDEEAWVKVKEGVYSGFSIGGTVTRKVDEEIVGLLLSEISLVDRPSNPGALFDVWKADNGRGGDKVEPEVLKKIDAITASVDVLQKTVEVMQKTVAAMKAPEPLKKEPEATGGSARELQLEAALEKLQKQVDDTDSAQRAKSKKELLDAGAAAGKFAVADRKQWEALHDKDSVLCASMLKTMQPVVPISQRIGSGGDGEETTNERCDKIVEQIMKDDKVTYDVAFAKAYGRNRALFERRDFEQLEIAKTYSIGVRIPE